MSGLRRSTIEAGDQFFVTAPIGWILALCTVHTRAPGTPADGWRIDPYPDSVSRRLCGCSSAKPPDLLRSSSGGPVQSDTPATWWRSCLGSAAPASRERNGGNGGACGRTDEAVSHQMSRCRVEPSPNIVVGEDMANGRTRDPRQAAFRGPGTAFRSCLRVRRSGTAGTPALANPGPVRHWRAGRS